MLKRLFFVIAVVAIMSVTTNSGKVKAGSNPSPLAGCGSGLDLVYWPNGEALIANQNGHVNGDGFVCVNDAPADKGDQGFVIIVDNVVPFRP